LIPIGLRWALAVALLAMAQSPAWAQSVALTGTMGQRAAGDRWRGARGHGAR